MGTSLKGKNLLPEQFLMVYHIRTPPLNVTNLVKHVMGATPMNLYVLISSGT